MYVQGKYWLNIENTDMLSLESNATTTEVPKFTTKINGLVRTCNAMNMWNYDNQWGVDYGNWDNRDDGWSQTLISSYSESAGPWYLSHESRIIDFGPTPQFLGSDSYYFVTWFNALYTPIPDEGFLDLKGLAKFNNLLLDEAYDNALAKFESLRPTLTSLRITSSKDLKVNLSQYDMVFLSATSYSGYDPLYYVVPTKIMLATPPNNFTLQVSDNSKSSTWKFDKSNYNYATRASGSGQLLYAYGLKIPEVE